MASNAPQNPPDTNDFIKGLWLQNPVFAQALGLCPALAVTNTAINALAMGLATLFVLFMSNLMVSSLRAFIPRQVRIACFVLIIASFVTIVDYLIQAIDLQLHRALGAFISLIVVNCLILSRAEAFASRNTVGNSMLDALGMGLGFTLALFCLGSVREILGNGSLFGFSLFGDSFEKWVVMGLPSGGFILLGLWVLLYDWLGRHQQQAAITDKAQQEAGT